MLERGVGGVELGAAAAAAADSFFLLYSPSLFPAIWVAKVSWLSSTVHTHTPLHTHTSRKHSEAVGQCLSAGHFTKTSPVRRGGDE